MRVRADEIKKDDKLPNGVVAGKSNQLHRRGVDELTAVFNQYGGWVATLPNDWLVEVERPEKPLVTITVTFPKDLAEHVTERWIDSWIDSANRELRTCGLVGQAIRAELNKETER